MENLLQDTDRTGCQIVDLSRRPDVQALRTVNALCRVSDDWRKLGDVSFLTYVHASALLGMANDKSVDAAVRSPSK